MIQVNTQSERLRTLPPKIVTGLAGAAGDVLPNRLQDSKVEHEVVYRMIQNLDANNPIFVSYGSDCGVTSFHKELGALQDLNVPTMERVSVWSSNAWSVATIEMMRLV